MHCQTPADCVREFQSSMGQLLDQQWEPGSSLEVFRTKLIKEEFHEFMTATTDVDALKELCDLLYVIYGYAATFGWDITSAFNRVHESNMSKLDDSGRPVYRSDGKVMKGPNYRPPNLGDLV